jgi:hypothetical protein
MINNKLQEMLDFCFEKQTFTSHGQTFKTSKDDHCQLNSVINTNIPLTSTSSLDQNDVIDSKIILMVEDVSTLVNLYLSYKERFSKILENKFILNQLKVKFQLPEYFDVSNFKEFVNVVKWILPPNFNLCNVRKREEVIDEFEALSPNLRWDTPGKFFWLDKLTSIEKFSKNIKRKKSYKFIVRDFGMSRCYMEEIRYSDLWGELTWDTNTYYSISHNFMTPSEKFYYFVNDEYNALSEDHKLHRLN